MSALPIWKDEIANRIEVVSRDGKLKTDDLSQKHKLLEESGRLILQGLAKGVN